MKNKQIKAEISKRASKEIKYGITEIKNILGSNRGVNRQPLGSDIEVETEDLEDLKGFLQKEESIVKNKEVEIYNDKKIIERLDDDINKRIRELESIVTPEEDQQSSASNKVSEVLDQLKIQKSQINIEKNKVALSESKFNNQLKDCKKLNDLIFEAQTLNKKMKAVLNSESQVKQTDNEIRSKIILRSIKNEIAYYIRAYRDLEYSLPEHLSNEPKFERSFTRSSYLPY